MRHAVAIGITKKFHQTLSSSVPPESPAKARNILKLRRVHRVRSLEILQALCLLTKFPDRVLNGFRHALDQHTLDRIRSSAMHLYTFTPPTEVALKIKTPD